MSIFTRILSLFVKHETPVSASRSILSCGKKVFVYTRTFYYVGEVKFYGKKNLCLTKVTRVIDTGVQETMLAKGSFEEFVIYPEHLEVLISREAINEIHPWEFDLPSKKIDNKDDKKETGTVISLFSNGKKDSGTLKPS